VGCFHALPRKCAAVKANWSGGRRLMLHDSACGCAQVFPISQFLAHCPAWHSLANVLPCRQLMPYKYSYVPLLRPASFSHPDIIYCTTSSLNLPILHSQASPIHLNLYKNGSYVDKALWRQTCRRRCCCG